MRKNQLIAAFALMVLLLVISFFTRDKASNTAYKPGDLVFSGVDENKLEKIIVKTTASKIESELVLNKNAWVLKNRFNMECDPAVIRKLFLAFKETKVIHVVNFKPEDLKLFLLSEENTTTIEFYTQNNPQPVTYRLGKTHSFKPESSGRYLYSPEKNALILLDNSLSFISGAPNVWVKKFLPFHEQIAGIAFVNGDNILWKAERVSAQNNFALTLPKNNNLSPQAVNQLMTYAIQMRYLDITPALNNFTVDADLKNNALYFNTFAGRTYKLNFLKKENDLIRCSINIISNKVKNEFKQDYGDDEILRDELVDWHFTIPYKIYEELYRL